MVLAILPMKLVETAGLEQKREQHDGVREAKTVALQRCSWLRHAPDYFEHEYDGKFRQWTAVEFFTVTFVVLAGTEGCVDEERERIAVPAVELLVSTSRERHADEVGREQDQQHIVLVKFPRLIEVGDESCRRIKARVSKQMNNPVGILRFSLILLLKLGLSGRRARPFTQQEHEQKSYMSREQYLIE